MNFSVWIFIPWRYEGEKIQERRLNCVGFFISFLKSACKDRLNSETRVQPDQDLEQSL
jgi:hypothetical protein